MDLSKTCDCLPHDILIAKLEAYGLDKSNLSLFNYYLYFRKQSTKNGSSYSAGLTLPMIFHRRSTLGPLLFNIYQ